MYTFCYYVVGGDFLDTFEVVFVYSTRSRKHVRQVYTLDAFSSASALEKAWYLFSSLIIGKFVRIEYWSCVLSRAC